MDMYNKVWPPPMECPIRNNGTGLGMTVLRNEVMSSSTRVVGPVAPLSEGFLAERPHPLKHVNAILVNVARHTSDRLHTPRCPWKRVLGRSCCMRCLASVSTSLS